MEVGVDWRLLLSEDPNAMFLSEAVIHYVRQRANEREERTQRERLQAALRG